MTRSDFLFVRPSLRRGVARLVDLGGTLDDSAYNVSDTPDEADAKALASDWQAVADDMREAFGHMVER